MPPLELLAPAGNLTLGKAAVDHGADAVYIGANRFGARAAAGNPVRDIAALCDHAHFYRAKVYVALNTLLFDHELAPARQLIYRLWDAGVDALIVQDMGLMELDLPPIPLFASTQTDNRSPEKVRFLEQSGFSRVILARELGLDAIAQIRAATQVDLEAFVHGALCVCYSGQCYMSAAIGGRSANRGACGQPCRLPWNLVTEKGKVLAKERYLLSLKDMDRSDHLAALADAGITSFKIEGRLKDLAYVKNITAHYRKKLDALIQGHPGYEKASSGKTVFFFAPDPAKTFNRGTTDYCLTRPDAENISSMETPKSRGEAVGTAHKITPEAFALKPGARGAAVPEIRNGDGLCFVDASGRFQGFRVNRVDGGLLYPPGKAPMKKIPLKKGMPVFRNYNHQFSRQMAGETAQRRLGVSLVLEETDTGVALEGIDEDGVMARTQMDMIKEPARDPARAEAAIKKQLGKLGRTSFEMTSLTLPPKTLFFQASTLNRLRRDFVERLVENRCRAHERRPADTRPDPVPYIRKALDYRGNVANKKAEKFYGKRAVAAIEPAFEIETPEGKLTVMTTRHCIRRSLGACPAKSEKRSFENRSSGKKSPDWDGPLYLESDQGRFRIVFDCKSCGMIIRR